MRRGEPRGKELSNPRVRAAEHGTRLQERGHRRDEHIPIPITVPGGGCLGVDAHI